MTGVFLTLLLSAIVGLTLIAKKLRVPYPIVFVIGGLVLALIPGVPTVTLAPETVFLLFLPALIFGDGWTTDYRAFKRFYQPIFMLAIGLVAFTSVDRRVRRALDDGLSARAGFRAGRDPLADRRGRDRRDR